MFDQLKRLWHSAEARKAADDDTRDPFFIPDLCTPAAVFIIVLVTELVAFAFSVASTGFSSQLGVRFGLTSLFAQWVTLTIASILCLVRNWLKDKPLVLAAALSYMIILLVTLISSVVAQWVILTYIKTSANLQIWNITILENLLISAIIGGLVLRYLYVQEEARVKHEAELKARIQALQSRIRPHFLFNSMNIIASLIAVDPHKAERVVEDLSELFRASLNDTGNEVALEQEIKLCQRYIDIEILRIGERLKVDWFIDENIDHIKIPLLTLQPLLENAIYHGIQPLSDGGIINVNITHNGHELQLEVENPIPAKNSSNLHSEGNRMALKNIEQRLRALYGSLSRINVQNSETRYKITINYPCTV